MNTKTIPRNNSRKGLVFTDSFLSKDFVNPPGHAAQSVTCLTADACLTANPGVSISVRSHTFVEIGCEISYTVILLPSAERLLSSTSESMCMKYWLTTWSSLPRKKCGLVN